MIEPTFTALVLDRDWQAHWVTMTAASAEAMAELALDELANSIIDGDDEDGDFDENSFDDLEPERQFWKDDVKLVRVWAGTHCSVPAAAPLHEEGAWPERPAAGTIIDHGGCRYRVLADLPAGFPDHGNPCLIPAAIDGPAGDDTRGGYRMLPTDSGLLVCSR